MAAAGPSRLARNRRLHRRPQPVRRTAIELKDEIETRVAALREHPKLYKPSARVKGLREMVVSRNYIVLYRITAACVEVVNVVHARRQWPARVSSAS